MISKLSNQKYRGPFTFTTVVLIATGVKVANMTGDPMNYAKSTGYISVGTLILFIAGVMAGLLIATIPKKDK